MNPRLLALVILATGCGDTAAQVSGCDQVPDLVSQLQKYCDGKVKAMREECTQDRQSAVRACAEASSATTDDWRTFCESWSASDRARYASIWALLVEIRDLVEPPDAGP